MNKQAIKECLELLLTDCQCQYNCLEQNDDIAWDCYDKDNWQGMIDNILMISKKLDIDIE